VTLLASLLAAVLQSTDIACQSGAQQQTRRALLRATAVGR